jgi:hypothetical protein
MDQELIRLAAPALESREKVEAEMPIRNVNPHDRGHAQR